MPYNPFKDRFPNLFEELHELESQQRDIALVEGYIESILARLRLPHYAPEVFLNTDGDYSKMEDKEVRSEGFFEDLIQVSDALCQKACESFEEDEAFELKLNIAGGVVRTLLGKMYQLSLERHEEQNKTNVHPDIIASIPEYKDFDPNVMALKSNMLRNPEFHIKQTTIAEKSPLYSPFVLGVGSDLDVFYEIRTNSGQPPTLAQQRAAQEVAKQLVRYINAVEEIKGLRMVTDAMKHSMLPVADVKEYHKQLDRVLEQGGSMLDTLAFTINPAPAKDKTPRRIKHAQGQEEVMRNFFKGVYEYIAPKEGEKSTQKQAIRGLRPLLELPFLNVKDKTLLEEELQSILKSVKEGAPLDPDAVKQFEKMLRNANFQGAGNRAYFDKESPIGIGLELARAAKTQSEKSSTGRLRLLLPEFLQPLPIESFEAKNQLKGNQYKTLQELMIAPEEFIKDYTTDGQLFHGTNAAAGMNILRGGFVVSSKDSGAAAFGPGTYTAKTYSGAEGYAGDDGVVLPIDIKKGLEPNIIRLSDIKKAEIYEALVQEAKEKGFADNDVDTESAVFALLRDRNEYAVDIIVANDNYLVIQNQAILNLDVDLQTMLDWFKSGLNSSIRSLFSKGTSGLTPFEIPLKAYHGFKNILEDMGLKDKNSVNDLWDLLEENLKQASLNEEQQTMTRAVMSLLMDNQEKIQELDKTYPGLKELCQSMKEKDFYQKIDCFNAFIIELEKPVFNEALKSLPIFNSRVVETIVELASRDNKKGVRDVLALSQVDLSVINKNERDPLCQAVAHGSVKAIECLIDMGALILSNQKESLVRLAISKDNSDILKALNNEDLSVHQLLGTQTALGLAVQFNAINSLKYLHNLKVDVNALIDIENYNEYQTTPLIFAYKQESYDMAAELLAMKVDPNITDPNGDSPLSALAYHLQYAKSEKKKQALVTLLEHGADPNIELRNGKKLHSVAEGDIELLNILIQHGLDISQPYDNYGNTLISNAITRDNVEMVEALLQAGVNPNKKQKYFTPFEEAVSMSKYQVIPSLITHGADVYGENNQGLERAIDSGDIKMVKVLIDAGVDVNRPCRYGKSAFEVAVGGGKTDIMELLIKSGADINVNLGQMFNNVIGAKDHERLKALIDLGANIECTEYYKKSPLRMAFEQNDLEAAKLLINLGADLNSSNGYNTILEHVISNGNLEAFNLLIDSGAKVTTDCLFQAISFNKDMIEPVVKAGADMQGKNRYNMTVLQRALNDLDVFNKLIECGMTLERSQMEHVNMQNYSQEIQDRVADVLAEQDALLKAKQSTIKNKPLRFSEKDKENKVRQSETNVPGHKNKKFKPKQ